MSEETYLILVRLLFALFFVVCVWVAVDAEGFLTTITRGNVPLKPWVVLAYRLIGTASAGAIGLYLILKLAGAIN